MTLQVWRKFYIVAFILFLVVYYSVLYFDLQPLSNYSDIIELIGITLSIPAFLLCVRQHGPGLKTPWILFAVTSVLFLTGEGLWAIISHTTGEEPSSPSICDLFYILNAITLILSFIYYVRTNKAIKIKELSIDIFISTFAAFGLIYIFTIDPYFKKESLDYFSIITQMLYSTCDIVLLFSIFVLCFHSQRHAFFRKTNILMISACLFMFLADQLSLIETAYHFDFGNYLEPIWGSMRLLIAIAGMYDCDYNQNQILEDTNERAINFSTSDNIRLIVPYLLTLLVLSYVSITHKMYDIPSIWSELLIIILCMRQFYLIINNRKLLSIIKQNENTLYSRNKELKILNEQIKHEADVDYLTKLYNRRYISDIISNLKTINSNIEHIGLLLLDVDLFKQINDKHGHQTGDEVLQRVAQCIMSVTRGNDIAGRFGGDEFIMLLPGADTNAVRKVVVRLLESVRNDAFLSRLKVSLSIGGTSCSVTGKDCQFTIMVKEADKTLYEAKEAGRDRAVVRQISPNPTT